MKLPKLALCSMATTTTWSSFWDSYEAIIHNKDLADVDKFNYLNSLMEGSFREVHLEKEPQRRKQRLMLHHTS